MSSTTLQWSESLRFKGISAPDYKDDKGLVASWDIEASGGKFKLYHTTHDGGTYQRYVGSYATEEEAKAHAD